MIAKFLLRRLPRSAEQNSLFYALEAASVARHARPHDWARLRGELAVEAEQPGTGLSGHGKRSDETMTSDESVTGPLVPSYS